MDEISPLRRLAAGYRSLANVADPELARVA
jgi:hypothetical protein